MISNQNTSTDPQLSREEAIEILNTPDENLDELIAGASERILRGAYFLCRDVPEKIQRKSCKYPHSY